MKTELNLPVKDKPITQEWEEDEQFVKVLVQKYMIDETIEFFEKQIQKLVDMSHCNCGMALDNVWKYCPNCGQALKWGGATDSDTSTD